MDSGPSYRITRSTRTNPIRVICRTFDTSKIVSPATGSEGVSQDELYCPANKDANCLGDATGGGAQMTNKVLEQSMPSQVTFADMIYVSKR